MDDIKKDARNATTDAKDAWRKADGETIGDDLATARDRASDAIKNAGDDLHKDADAASREMSYDKARPAPAPPPQTPAARARAPGAAPPLQLRHRRRGAQRQSDEDAIRAQRIAL